MEYWGLGMMGAGALSGAVGAFYSARNSRLALEGQARVSDINAKIAEIGAQQEIYRGQQEAAAVSRRAGAIKSAQRVSMAANGIDLGEGSAGELQASTDMMKEIDMKTAELNAMSAAWGLRTQASNFRTDAQIGRIKAGGANAGLAAVSSLLTSGGKVASSWYGMNKAGGGPPQAGNYQRGTPGYSGNYLDYDA